MLGANSHSCGRGGFFLPWQKKDQGSVGKRSQMFFRRDPILKIRQPVKKILQILQSYTTISFY